ncbi:MAG: DNA-directed RNA polymerase subunit beta' [bacterium]|nr:DNA-directed RNA polymerase subunit beta' [bacterium]
MDQDRRNTSSALDVNEFGRLRIGLATADSIRTWSNGEVKKPETINYRTLKPEKDGLFCEKIFGPQKDWECTCGKYKRIRFKGIICERCGVEVTRTKVRRERMGHIELAAPVVHIWYLRGTRSWLAYLLTGTEPREEVKAKQLEKVVYFAAHLVVRVDAERRDADLGDLERDMHEELRIVRTEFEERRADILATLEAELEELEEAGGTGADIRNRRAAAERELEELDELRVEELEKIQNAFDVFKDLYPRQIIEDEELWSELIYRYQDYFDGGMGADAIAQLIDECDFDAQEEELRLMVSPPEGTKPLSAQRKHKAIRRLRIVSAFNNRDEHGRRVNDPRAMILDVVPVIPPDLRPMVQLDGGRFATSDLNDLYRRVINRNNRLKRLLDLGAPEIIVNNERRMLQEAVDALFDNGRRGRPVSGPGNRPLKSLSDMLKGKQGRFRQNLLGKRVDYSGRSVIVVGPTLKFHQCGLPRLMALELFKPFVMKNLVEQELAPNIKSAKRMVERRRPMVWGVLEEVIKEHPVLLNRAPTLHRLGIQAFEAVLVGGKAVQIHPLVCAAFNADFDGDQMAVHLPLSAEAQAEARVLMLSANNVLSPAHGSPLVTPTQDMIIGTYYLTLMNPEGRGAGRVFRDPDEVLFAYEAGLVDLHAPIEYRIPELRRAAGSDGAGGDGEDGAGSSDEGEGGDANGRAVYEPTTVGRILLSRQMPEGFGFINEELRRTSVGRVVEQLARNYPKAEVARSLDGMKDLCFRFATQSGLTISLDDIKVPADKPKILERRERQAQSTQNQFRRGIISDGERRQKEIETWLEATQEVQDEMVDALAGEGLNPLNMMVDSGARGNMMQLRQIAGMRGVVANPRGDMISRPIKSNFREGLSVLEYFISTPGARKGLVDTALRTADSGYLTRRLVDVAQELIINDEDPFENDEPVPGMHIDLRSGDRPLEVRLLGRVLADGVTLDDGTELAAGEMVTRRLMERIAADSNLERVRVLSPLTDNSLQGISAKSYGMSLATGALIETGEAVGVIAAQSIGEPGTQLTMRTFHTSGAIELGRSVSDIARGLPRVVELFEARTPKGKATLARSSGTLRVDEPDGQQQRLRVVAPDGSEEKHLAVVGARLEFDDGDEVEAGDVLVEGNVDPKELLEIKGLRAVQQYLTDEVQAVYREQGVSIHDKHIELIVRQMTRRVLVQESGDSDFLPGERVDARRYRDANRQLITEEKRPAQGRPELMGITKASLATDSWLSAASFQTTTQVLTESAIESRSDDLSGLKENIMIGKLIPAGTGIAKYRNVAPHAPEYVPMEVYSEEYDEFAEGYADIFGVLPEPFETGATTAEVAEVAEAIEPAGLTAETAGL